MGNLIFHVAAQLRHGVFIAVRDKDRIIAEAAAAGRRKGNSAGAFPSRTKHVAVGEGAADAGNEFCSAVDHALQLFQQEKIALLVRVCMVSRETGGINAGRTVQCIDHQAGIVRYGDLTGGLCHGRGFQQGVFLKSFAGLLHLELAAGITLGYDLNAEIG